MRRSTSARRGRSSGPLAKGRSAHHALCHDPAAPRAEKARSGRMMRRQKSGFGWVLVVVAAMAMIAAACGGGSSKSSSSSSGKTTVAFAFVGPLTGPNANLGINSRNGAAVAVKQANAAQAKYNFVLKDFDTQGDPAQAPGQAAKYIADTQILAVVGPTFSGE